MTDDLAARIQRLEDRAEISDLVGRYTLHAAAGEPVELAALFTEGGTFHAHTGSVTGRANLATFFAGSLFPGRTVPIVGQLHLEFTGEGRANGRCLMATNFYEGKPGGFCGHYRDELEKVDGRWLFASRNYTFYHAA